MERAIPNGYFQIALVRERVVKFVVWIFRFEGEKWRISRATLAVTLRPRALRVGSSSPTPAATTWPIARGVRVRATRLGGGFPPENLPFRFSVLACFLHRV